eukprot:snap_masked-scaffold_51-processed-gene-1.13-mRNA-1 protein AED:1.00 eAED:1.00 QI:0/-1/0/0/-1/1/1/0/363
MQRNGSKISAKHTLLKKSCSRCVTLKRKCDSLKPTCTRCKKRGAICSYEVSSKRGPKNKELVLKGGKNNLFSREEKQMLSTLFFPELIKEKRLSNMFSRINSSKSWTFNYIEKSAELLSSKYHDFVLSPVSHSNLLLSAKLLSTLDFFMKSVSLDENSLVEFQSYFIRILNLYKLSTGEINRLLARDFNFRLTAELNTKKFWSFEHKYLYPNPSRLPDYKAYCRIYWNEEGEDYISWSGPKFQVNPQFKKYFGFDATFLSTQLSSSIQSCLSSGANVLTLLTDEKSVLHFLSVNEFQIANIDIEKSVPKNGPWETSYSSSVILKLELVDEEWKPFQINTISRQMMTETKFLYEIRMYFTPREI